MKKIKLIVSIIAMLMCVGSFSLTAYADDPVDPVTGDTSDISSEPDDPSTSSDPGGDTSSDVSSDVPISSVVDEPTVPVEPDPDVPEEPIDSSSEPYDDPYSNSYDDGNNYYSSDYEYSDDDTNYISSYVGGGQTYVVPDSTAPSAALYNVNGKVDGNELNSKDWDDIAESLKNASVIDGDGDDFSFIQKNNSAFDNGDWMLFAGIACLFLSAAGIAYVTISTVKARKKLSVINLGKPNAGGKHAVAVNSVSGSEYGDGFSSSSDTKNVEKAKSDTANAKLNKKNKKSGKYSK